MGDMSDHFDFIDESDVEQAIQEHSEGIMTPPNQMDRINRPLTYDELVEQVSWYVFSKTNPTSVSEAWGDFNREAWGKSAKKIIAQFIPLWRDEAALTLHSEEVERLVEALRTVRKGLFKEEYIAIVDEALRPFLANGR